MNKLSRRDFLKTSAFVGGAGFLALQIPKIFETLARAEQGYLTPTELYSLAQPENQLYSVCLQCNTGCGIKVKILDGVAVKIDGNPLSPWTMHPHLPYKTSPFEIANSEGALCPKGQAGLQTAYDPYRIRKVLKRKPGTKRGENQWVAISFDQAITEIVEGGDLFSEGHVAGLRELWALRDPQVAAAMKTDIAKLWAAHDSEEKKQLVKEFQEKYQAHLDKLIDPERPDLGPVNNQLVFLWGRVKGGREHFIRRFTEAAFGSINAHGHTTVCQGSLYFTGKAMSEQYQDGKWTGGSKFYWQADTENSEFLIFVGASPFEANYGPPVRAPHITENIVENGLKIAVVDPRLSKTAAKAWKWLPSKPGTEAALALAMIRWIIENGRYDRKYLQNANKAAARADSEPTWCNASWLVKIENGQPTTFLRAHEAGLSEKDRFVVAQGDRLIDCNPYDEQIPVEGDLFPTLSSVNGISVKTALQVLYDSARTHTIEEWAQICGLKVKDILELAHEFTAHGKRAAADIHRGVSQHTNGFYNVFAWYALNLLLGNFDWAGGLIKKTEYDAIGDKDGKPFPLKKLHPNKTTPVGISIIRHGVKYEDTTLFEKYPAKRPWFPLSSDVYQEVIPSAGDAYPYPIKALFLYMGTPAYSLPAGQTTIEILSDPKKIPLIVANDITIGETTMYADYIFPDLSYLERWEFHGSHPNIAPKVQPVRQPVIAPIPETVKVFGEEVPISLEALLLGIAEKLGLPGFGPKGLGDAGDFTRPEDFYLKMVANVAFGDKPDGSDAVPDADDHELELFLKARSSLPPSVFDPERWRQSVGESFWPQIVYVLNRGGRFQDHEKTYKDGKVANPYGTLINLYQEKTYKTKNSMTGEHFWGYPAYLPAPTDVLGQLIEDGQNGFDLHLITYRVIHQTKSRTISNYWLLGIEPENAIVVNKRDADRLGLAEGDRVKVISASNPAGVWDLKNGQKIQMVGKLKTIQGLRPGVIAFSLGYGHWAYGSDDVVIDGQVIPKDERRAKGIHANAAMRIDPVLKNTCLQDVTGGSVSFYDSQVKLVKV
jgi:anaerobic selenocysteine-containing dehydrogenase